ncbi:ATP-binding protein [Cytobacillus horneckiae]|uniref:ATP-binding protein n=1 Tax=Cytobacillus horneckiae TaxID=549687 RepID=UPI003D9AA852
MSIIDEEYIKFVEQSPDATILLQRGIIRYINDLGVNLFGAAQKEEMIGNGLLEFLSTEYFETFNHMIEEIEQEGHSSFQEMMFFKMNGTTFEVELKGISIHYEHKSVIYLILRSVEGKKKTEQFLMESEKLLIAGQLAAGIVHEVRNPLTSIKGFIQLSQSQYDEDKNRFYLNIIQTEIERIELILTELLTLTKPRNSHVESNDVEQLLQEVITLIDTQAIMNNIDIHITIKDKLPVIYCDKNQLKQVLINIIKNSIEAIINHGSITIEGNIEGKHIHLCITDSGPGIPAHLLKRIEEPFFTTKENGTGLGLMICRQIIESHNGSMKIRSSSKGTKIHILLPINTHKMIL